jgi:hypothetical protein
VTAQIMDKIQFERRSFALADDPLQSWLGRRKNRRMRFPATSSACRRGYRCGWEVSSGRLYLTKFVPSVPGSYLPSLSMLFENYSEQYYAGVAQGDPNHAGAGAFAFWVSDGVRCPFGELLEYHHSGFESVWEFDLLLSFQSGFLVGSRIRLNGLEQQERLSRARSGVGRGSDRVTGLHGQH